MPYYDHNKDYPFAAFITNLGKYNEGELVGILKRCFQKKMQFVEKN